MKNPPFKVQFMGYEPTQVTADTLNGTHIGRRISVEGGAMGIYGILSAVHHEAETVSERPMCGPENYALGRKSVKVEMLGGAWATLRPDATVSLAD